MRSSSCLFTTSSAITTLWILSFVLELFYATSPVFYDSIYLLFKLFLSIQNRVHINICVSMSPNMIFNMIKNQQTSQREVWFYSEYCMKLFQTNKIFPQTNKLIHQSLIEQLTRPTPFPRKKKNKERQMSSL